MSDRIDFQCPDCGMASAVGTVTEGPEELVGQEIVEHVEPRCAFFVMSDPMEFLERAHAKIIASRAQA
jgi:hypothetical protein